jgi:alkanesulfonate monooxygenase SsuD/methylene tetrahydromethanopterin reductase-like flavin-dependent oxidoreductase (luciferase family)
MRAGTCAKTWQRNGDRDVWLEVRGGSPSDLHLPGAAGRRFISERSAHVVGSPQQIADRFEELHDVGGRNGRIILSKSFSAPGMLRDFVELVVPELQRRGLMKKQYAGSTLRENLNN